MSHKLPFLAAVFTVAFSTAVVSAAGPDVILSDSTSISSHGLVGTIRGYSIGSNTCNIGNQNLLWTGNNTPGLAANAYRLHNGRLEQIGMSWVKTACCAAAGNGCGLNCNNVGGQMLGAGCLDVYTASWNSSQSRKARRSGINAFTGAFAGADPATGNAIFKRLQIEQADLEPANFPGALYFFEGVYAGTDDAVNSNWLNNASYKRVTFNASFTGTYAGAISPMRPAIYAWQDHGLGVGIPDPSVTIDAINIPGEGRMYLGYKATDLGGGLWRYDYALYNLNSDRSAGGFAIAAPGVTATNIGFHDVNYHSGEPYDNTDWVFAAGSTGVAWQSSQSFAQNQNANALRWGTMYSFWFTANAPPKIGQATITLFKPHTPQSITTNALVPGCGMPGDVSENGVLNGSDIRQFTSCMTAGGEISSRCYCADTNQNGEMDMGDIDAFVADLLAK